MQLVKRTCVVVFFDCQLSHVSLVRVVNDPRLGIGAEFVINWESLLSLVRCQILHVEFAAAVVLVA